MGRSRGPTIARFSSYKHRPCWRPTSAPTGSRVVQRHESGAAGASADIGTGLSASGYLYKNLTGAKQAILITVHTAAATPVAGTLEIDMEYYIKDIAGSNP